MFSGGGLFFVDAVWLRSWREPMQIQSLSISGEFIPDFVNDRVLLPTTNNGFYLWLNLGSMLYSSEYVGRQWLTSGVQVLVDDANNLLGFSEALSAIIMQNIETGEAVIISR